MTVRPPSAAISRGIDASNQVSFPAPTTNRRIVFGRVPRLNRARPSAREQTAEQRLTLPTDQDATTDGLLAPEVTGGPPAPEPAAPSPPMLMPRQAQRQAAVPLPKVRLTQTKEVAARAQPVGAGQSKRTRPPATAFAPAPMIGVRKHDIRAHEVIDPAITDQLRSVLADASPTVHANMKRHALPPRTAPSPTTTQPHTSARVAQPLVLQSSSTRTLAPSPVANRTSIEFSSASRPHPGAGEEQGEELDERWPSLPELLPTFREVDDRQAARPEQRWPALLKEPATLEHEDARQVRAWEYRRRLDQEQREQ